MIKMDKKPLRKYFELPIREAVEWEMNDYMVFVIESMYSTVIPFISGLMLAKTERLLWLFMLVLPIYIRLRVNKKILHDTRNKRIYVK